jgi:hypothetical protein
MPERARSSSEEPLLDLPEDESLSTEHLDSQVQKAQEALLQLKRQQDLIERQKRELEELSRRQEQLQQGKSEMVDKFVRAMVILERETYEAKKRVESLEAIHASFSGHLDVLESINPKTWEGLDINRELTKAISAVDDARAEYANNLPRISPETESGGSDPVAAGMGYQVDYGGGVERDAVYWLKAGFFFTLPLFVVGVVLLLLIYAAIPTGPR